MSLNCHFRPLWIAVIALIMHARDCCFAAETTKPTAQAVPQSAGTVDTPRKLRAQDVYDDRSPILFADNFASGSLEKWKWSVDDRYDLKEVDSKRMHVVDAAGLGDGQKAACFTVERAPNVFRAELGLPHEDGFHERWYAGRIQVPQDWVVDQTPGDDIVMQWHAIPGNWRATYPNLSISILNDRWLISQSFGNAQEHPTRTRTMLDHKVQPGRWVAWVIHAKWSPHDDGIVEIWQDGKLAFERKGANVYGTIGVEYTPYLKTGIYHPEWHLDSDAKREAFEAEKPSATKKVVYVTDIKIGDARAKLTDFLPGKPEK